MGYIENRLKTKYEDAVKKQLIEKVKGYVEVWLMYEPVLEMDVVAVKITYKVFGVKEQVFTWFDTEDFWKLILDAKPASYVVDKIMKKYDGYTESVKRAMFYKNARD